MSIKFVIDIYFMLFNKTYLNNYNWKSELVLVEVNYLLTGLIILILLINQKRV